MQKLRRNTNICLFVLQHFTFNDAQVSYLQCHIHAHTAFTTKRCTTQFPAFIGQKIFLTAILLYDLPQQQQLLLLLIGSLLGRYAMTPQLQTL